MFFNYCWNLLSNKIKLFLQNLQSSPKQSNKVYFADYFRFKDRDNRHLNQHCQYLIVYCWRSVWYIGPTITYPFLGFSVRRLMKRVQQVLALQMEMWSVKLELYAMYSMECTVYRVLSSVHSFNSVVHRAQCTEDSFNSAVHKCRVYGIQFQQIGVQSSVYRIQFTVYSMHCTVHSMQYTAYSSHCTS